VSFLSTRVVADSLARAFAALVNPAAKPGVRFLEIPGRTTATSIPTRHGDTSAAIYHPAEQTGRRPAVYLNVHGGGFVIGHPEQDDPWCRYLAAHADVVVVNTDYVLAPHRRFPSPAEQIYDVLQWGRPRVGRHQSLRRRSERRRKPLCRGCPPGATERRPGHQTSGAALRHAGPGHGDEGQEV
jgi:acetyl esterase/lipase